MINCVTLQQGGSPTATGEASTILELFPHFVASGDRFIAPDEASIDSVSFSFGDAAILFYDFDAFGYVIDAKPFIETIAHANKLSREIPVGPFPLIGYFTGKLSILNVETLLGGVSVDHNLRQDMGGPSGIRITSSIRVTISFISPVKFEEAMLRATTLLDFFGLIVGNPRSLVEMRLSSELAARELRVYWSMFPDREAKRSDMKPQPADVLVPGVQERAQFSSVLAGWLARQAEFRDARRRFLESFENGEVYGINRLVASANMFDILPPSAVPQGVELPAELLEAKSKCRELFTALNESPERDSVLSALGRIGKSGLRSKACHWASILSDGLGKALDEIDLVLAEAVKCRNHYVHGSEASFDYAQNFDIVTFFIDALEFVFAASDLAECGWSVSTWRERGSSLTHPFARFLSNYPPRLKALKKLLT
jgi:hypothetical protein